MSLLRLHSITATDGDRYTVEFIKQADGMRIGLVFTVVSVAGPNALDVQTEPGFLGLLANEHPLLAVSITQAVRKFHVARAATRRRPEPPNRRPFSRP